MKTRYILAAAFLVTGATADAFDNNSEHPGLLWNQAKQDIVFTSVGKKTRIQETTTGKVHVLDCPIGDVRIIDQYKVLWPIPVPVKHEYEAICVRGLQGPGTFAHTGVGKIVGLDHP